LFLGRISPVKKVLEFIEWAETKDFKKITIAGPIGDKEYGERVKLKIESANRRTKSKINYVGPVNQEGARKLYQTHEIYVNMTPAGSFDKTILEALACGCRLRIDNPEAQGISVENHSLKQLIKRIKLEIS